MAEELIGGQAEELAGELSEDWQQAYDEEAGLIDYKLTDEQKFDAKISQNASKKADEQKETQLSAQAQAMADELAADACAEIDKAKQAIADLPGKIEDKISELKKKFEAFLGKIDTSDVDPERLEFDPDKAIAKVKKVVQPALASVKPLEAVAGKVPIIGDLVVLFAEASAAKAPASDMTKEEIKKAVPTKPEIPPAIKNSIDALIDTIKTVCMTLPMTLINLIFMMINVIYSKLKIITSIIPLGGMFPLSLVGTAMSSVPKIMTFIQQAPAMIKDMVIGMVKDKIAEAQALGITQPPTAEQLAALAAQKAAEKGKSVIEAAKENREEKLKAKQKKDEGAEQGEQAAGGSESGSEQQSNGSESSSESGSESGSGSEQQSGGSSSDSGQQTSEDDKNEEDEKPSSPIADVPKVEEFPPAEPCPWTIPEVKEMFRSDPYGKFYVYTDFEYGDFNTDAEAYKLKSQDDGELYDMLFQSAYILNTDLSSPDVKNGKRTYDQMDKYKNNIKTLEADTDAEDIVTHAFSIVKLSPHAGSRAMVEFTDGSYHKKCVTVYGGMVFPKSLIDKYKKEKTDYWLDIFNQRCEKELKKPTYTKDLKKIQKAKANLEKFKKFFDDPNVFMLSEQNLPKPSEILLYDDDD